MVSTRQMSTIISSTSSSSSASPPSSSVGGTSSTSSSTSNHGTVTAFSISGGNGGNDDDAVPLRPAITTRQSSNASSGNALNLGIAVTSPSIGSLRSSNGGGSPYTRQHHHQQQQQQQQLPEDNVTKQRRIFLLDLPIEILDKIFSYVGYKKVGQMRVVSKQMNHVCSAILNSTFNKLQIQMLNRFQTVKAKMPRRESARRNHPLACECDIIETCYMRLSLLQMTFGKHIERKHCCFFPGGILDEVYNILNYIRNTPKLERPYKVTDELFDLSTMAMEYFKEHIEPTLPEIAYFTKSKTTFSLKTTTDLLDTPSSSPPQSNMVLRKGIRKIKQGMKMYNNQLTALRSELRNCKRKSSEQGKQIAEQQKLLAEQQKQTLEYANRLDENDKKNEEMSRKFSTLLQELNKCKTELQYWRSKSPATQVCTSCGQKIAPVAPEDYQALVNQGVKPEDININLDDTDESETASATSESMILNQVSTEFVYPDEQTTAKLKALERNRNLKRQYEEAIKSSTHTSIDIVTPTNEETTVQSLKRKRNITDLNCYKGLQIDNERHTEAGSNLCAFPSFVSGNSNKEENFRNFSMRTAASSVNFTPINAVETTDTVETMMNGENKCSTTSLEDITSGNLNSAITVITTVNNTVSSSSNISNETKKARRVQNKGSNRCHNLNNKRNK